MNDEIKEIITRMASYTIHYDCCSEGDAEEDIDKLLDYITNLQNRIIELEEINKQHQEINSELRTKIGKVVEYIKTKGLKEEEWQNGFCVKATATYTREEIFDLLNILQDKEEV